MDKVLSVEPGTPSGLRHPSPPPLHISYCGTSRLQCSRGEREESHLEPESPAGCIYKRRERASDSYFGPNTGQPDKDYVQRLKRTKQCTQAINLQCSLELHYGMTAMRLEPDTRGTLWMYAVSEHVGDWERTEFY